MSKLMVAFGLLGLLTQYIAVPVLTERFRMRDSTLGALALLTASGSSVITAFATEEWHIWVAGIVSFLGVATTTSIRSNITKCVGPFEVGAVFSILATFQAENFFIGLKEHTHCNSSGQFICRPQTFVELQLRFKLHFYTKKMQFET